MRDKRCQHCAELEKLHDGYLRETKLQQNENSE